MIFDESFKMVVKNRATTSYGRINTDYNPDSIPYGNCIVSREQVKVFLGTPQQIPTPSEALAIAVVKRAFPDLHWARATASVVTKWIEDPSVLTIGLVSETDVSRRNIGKLNTTGRNNLLHSTGSMAWYSFGQYCLEAYGISGPFTEEVKELIDKELFVPLDTFNKSWFSLLGKDGRKGASINRIIKAAILGEDEVCLSHIVKAADILLTQQLDRACLKMSEKLKAQGYRLSTALGGQSGTKRSMLLDCAEVVQQLGNQSFLAPEKPAKSPDTLKNDIASEVAKIIEQRFPQKK